MLKLDFSNKDYTLQEVIDALTDGNISNYNYDKDFLDFIISWSLGKHLEGPAASKYKEYKGIDGILNLMRLDEYGYFGKKMYKIYEICGKDKMSFIKTCDLIGEYPIMHRIGKNTIETNLKLQKPVSFLDDSIILENGKKPIFRPTEYSNYDLSFQEEMEFNHEIERSLRHRINESIKENGDNLELLVELPPYKEQELQKIKERKEKALPQDYEIDINNLYFGMEEHDISSGLLGMHMANYSWFEYMNTKIMNYHVFRSIPQGNFYLIDETGKIYNPEKLLNKDSINIESMPTIEKVQLMNIPSIFKESIKNEEQNNKDELTLLRLNGILEQLESSEKIKVNELNNYKNLVRYLYDDIYERTYNGNKKL